MKKYLMFVFLMIITIFSYSCGINKKVESFSIGGEELTAEDIEEISKTYKDYHANDDNKFKEWYKIDYVITITEQSSENIINTTVINISGKCFESYVLYDTRMKLEIKIEYNGQYVDEFTDVQFIADCVFVEGTVFYDIDISGKQEKTNFTTEISTKQKLYASLSSLTDIVQVDIPDLTSTSSTFGELLNLMEENKSENVTFTRRNNTFFCEEKEEDNVSIMAVEVDDQYLVEKVKMYAKVKKNDTEVLISGDIKKCFGTIIKKPSDSEDYKKSSDININIPF